MDLRTHMVGRGTQMLGEIETQIIDHCSCRMCTAAAAKAAAIGAALHQEDDFLLISERIQPMVDGLYAAIGETSCTCSMCMDNRFKTEDVAALLEIEINYDIEPNRTKRRIDPDTRDLFEEESPQYRAAKVRESMRADRTTYGMPEGWGSVEWPDRTRPRAKSTNEMVVDGIAPPTGALAGAFSRFKFASWVTVGKGSTGHSVWHDFGDEVWTTCGQMKPTARVHDAPSSVVQCRICSKWNPETLAADKAGKDPEAMRRAGRGAS